MVRCVVSGCPNRPLRVNQGPSQRATRRFFTFPEDPVRVKVWLAALRETDEQTDPTEQHLICEDHFLPEDISTDGVNSDAIPIMPPYLDGPVGLIGPWGAGSPEEEDEEEEEQWTARGCDDDDDDDDEGAASPAAPDPPQAPGEVSENPPDNRNESVEKDISFCCSAALPQRKRSSLPQKVSRHDASLALLTRRFLELLLSAPGGSLDLRQVAASLQTRKRRVYDITNVLSGIELVQKESANRIKWTGRSPISSFLWKNHQKLQSELEKLQVVEDSLDDLIRSSAQQLFHMTDDVENSDVGGLGVLQEQTVIVVKAPEETKLEIPAPREDRVQVHLKSGRGPVVVVTCEVGSGDAVTADPGKKGRGSFFLTLEESRVRTTTLHSGEVKEGV
ncbi:putative transcription factor E2F6-like [Scophthalmus maximus]|uniref:Putative transcription factor E2F6-like n=1 Tax=Scophthalmus maximus TaxID=52904 RepID=A0A2U9CV77_SCOMX|nr:putative transcription factor E2F6-like [Scophthalmus maximus]